jgi:endonuclease/exonuclease/phosphatase family metal-dependent hydrolase
MTTRTRKFLRIFFWSVLFIVVLPIGLFLFLMVAEFRPAPVIRLAVKGPGTSQEQGPLPSTITFLTWNIGYAGLGKEMDFFYEGGTDVRPAEEACYRYLEGIRKFLSEHGDADFVFIQEADVHSRRSWYTSQVDSVSRTLGDHFCAYATNYRCAFVPVPVRDPMGRVEGGIATFSRLRPDEAVRYGYEAQFPWPQRLVMLKRCFLTERFRLPEGKDLVVINLHNSAYDESGELRNAEIIQLESFIRKEWAKGNYIIVGGDWNSSPRGFDPATITSGDRVRAIAMPPGSGILAGWKCTFDPSRPTNRDVDGPYRKGKTRTTVIDFFVVSPNISVISCETVPTGFECSDHQPVMMKVRPDR